jgi:transcriptional regulator GlxA family with amidase domain
MKLTRRTFGWLVLAGTTAGVLGLSPTQAGTEEAPAPKGHGMGSRVDPKDKTQVAILFYDMSILFDYGPAAEIFRVAQATNAFNVYSVGTSPNPIPAMFPSALYADYSLDNAPAPDVVVVPGGDWNGMKDRADVAAWLRGVLDRGGIVMSVCTGGFLLGQWGILDGIPVTGLHAQLDDLQTIAPKARIIRDVPFIDAGNIVTTAGAATSLDAALHLVRRLKGEEAARWVAEVYLDHGTWDPDFDGDPARFQ